MHDAQQIFLNTKEKKLAFFQNIVSAATAGKDIDEKKKDFLLSIGEQLNLSAFDVRPIMDNLASLPFIIPKTGLQKQIELRILVMMVLQEDGEMELREYELCLAYAKLLGYNNEILGYFIHELKTE